MNKSMRPANSHRKISGSTLGIVAVCALIIIIAIVAGFRLSVWLASSQEMKNSVDAGALNVAKRVFEIKNDPGQNEGFDDVADSQKAIGLSNINRVWGKAYLVNANAEALVRDGYGPVGPAPEIAFQRAKLVNDRLHGRITNNSVLSTYFNKIAGAKPAKLLGEQGAVSAGDTSLWETAAVYRGEESNLLVSDLLAIPPGLKANLHTKDKVTFMQGYNPTMANSKYFGFVTFHANEAPHLVSNSTFDQWKTAPVGNSPARVLPNAFKESGQIDGQVSLAATASAVANPMRTYLLAIPHSFVKITLSSKATIRLDDGFGHVNMYQETPYFHNTGTIQPFKSVDLEAQRYQYPQSGKSGLRVTGLLSGYVSLGNELKPDNLWQAINALPGDHAPAIDLVLQRVKQFKPGYSQSELKKLLESQKLVNDGTSKVTYLIFPTYGTPDNTDPQVKIGTIGQQPKWLSPEKGPDASKSKVIVREITQKDEPNKAWSTIIDGHFELPNKPRPEWPNYAADAHRTALSGTLSWQPGTGWEQCLGELSIDRKTDVIFTGWPTQSVDRMNDFFGPVN